MCSNNLFVKFHNPCPFADNFMVTWCGKGLKLFNLRHFNQELHYEGHDEWHTIPPALWPIKQIETLRSLNKLCL